MLLIVSACIFFLLYLSDYTSIQKASFSASLPQSCFSYNILNFLNPIPATLEILLMPGESLLHTWCVPGGLKLCFPFSGITTRLSLEWANSKCSINACCVMNTSQFCRFWLCDDSETHIKRQQEKAVGSQFLPRGGSGQRPVPVWVWVGAEGRLEAGGEPARICLTSLRFPWVGGGWR